jgi:polyhydroxyalkanoate synthesis regulator phasin
MSNNSNSVRLTYHEFMKAAKQRAEQANEMFKSSSNAELAGAKDPSDKGKVTIPGFGDGANRAAQGLPQSMDNFGQHGSENCLSTVSDPQGTGEGTYITPKDGDAKDKAATSPTTPLSKIAQAQAALKAATTAKTAHVQSDVELPSNIQGDPTLMQKLAAISQAMLATEHGRRYVNEFLEKEAGMQEANGIIEQVRSAMMQKQASEQAAVQEQYIMEKSAASVEASHNVWLNQCQDVMEKIAYATGAVDGQAAAEAAMAGEEPGIEGEEPTAEDVMECLQELVEAGEVSPEEAQAVIASLGEAAEDGISGEELAEILRAGVESGEISPEQAEAIAQAYMEDLAGAEGEEVAEEEEMAPEMDAEAAAAAAPAVEKAASVMHALWNN